MAITDLALEMSTPAHPGGGLLSAQLHRWPPYRAGPRGDVRAVLPVLR
ncbi:hypothetical protein [Streptomyces sp. NPDC046978]